MTKLATITINGKEQFFDFRDADSKFVIQISGVRRVEFWHNFDLFEGIAGLSFIVPSKEYPGKYSFDLNQFARLYRIRGRWKNQSGYGHTMAKQSTHNAQFIAYDGIDRS